MIQMKSLQKVVVISEALKQYMIDLYPMYKDKFFVAHDGADEVKQFNKIDLKGDASKIKIGYVGHLYKGKGMEVIANIVNKLPLCEFHIVGGLEEDVKTWQKEINAKNIYFYGFVAQNKVSLYINSFDIVLLPNQKVILPNGAKSIQSNISQFTSPLKMFEYMAHKKAIVASNLAVLKEVLSDDTAVFAISDNYDDWVKQITLLVEDSVLRNKIANNAFKEFKKYTWKVRAKNVTE